MPLASEWNLKAVKLFTSAHQVNSAMTQAKTMSSRERENYSSVEEIHRKFMSDHVNHRQRLEIKLEVSRLP